MSVESSAAKFYGLTEIPFEPTGAAVEKYPYVAPLKFDRIEEVIGDVTRERKLYVVLLRSPQGGGKTATATEIRRRVEGKRYAAGKGILIFNRLVDLDFAHYAVDFVEEAKPFLPDLKSEKYRVKGSPGELKNALASILKNLGSRYNLVVWIIDEFDIMVDYPKEKQSQFLQILREIIDDLANRKLPILFVMSHTIKSSKEFEKHLKGIHGPFESRIVQSIDIGYTYSETRAIVIARLKSVRKEKLEHSSVEPFSEEAMKQLYDLVLATGGSDELNDFRLFERCCYFSILNGAHDKRHTISQKDVMNEFDRQFKSWTRTETGDRLSLAVRAARSSIFAGSQMGRNDAMLRGLARCLTLMRDQFSEISAPRTSYVPGFPQGNHVSTLRFIAMHAPTGKKISAVWILVTKESGMVMPDDLERADSIMPRGVASAQAYANLSVLSYVSDVDVESSHAISSDCVIRVPRDAASDLVGLSVESATDDDVDVLRKTFESEIAPTIRKVFSESACDITKEATPTVVRLSRALNILHATGSRLTRENLKEEEKKLFGLSSRTTDRHLTDLISLGFAKEEGTEIVPKQPRALVRLRELLRDGPKEVNYVRKEFDPNGEAVLKVAQTLGLVRIEEDRVVDNLQDLKLRVQKQAGEVGVLLSGDVQNTYDGTRATKIAKAVEKRTDDISGAIILSGAGELLPQISEGLRKSTEVAAGSTGAAAQAQQLRATSVPPSRTQTLAARSGAGELEETITSILSSGQPMTLEELKKELAAKGLSEDVTSKVVKMLLQNRLKLAA